MSEKIGNTTLREKVSKEVTAVMMARAPDLPLPKAQAKVASALGWWIGAGVCVFVGFAFAAGGMYIAAQKDMTLVLAVMLGLFILLPFLGALFCANRASGEATAAFIETVRSLVGIGRKAVKGNEP